MKSLIVSPLRIGPITINNRAFLAPLSGITDEAFRARAISHGAGLVVSEMVASGELAKGNRNSELRIRRPDVPVHVVQLAGRDAHWMAEGAKIAAGEGADIIDINMGCPAKKVTGGYCGSALMKDPDHALSLIESVVSAVKVPVTVKMRLGWDENSLNAPSIARRAQDAGVQMVTIHGRTRCQFYQGRADWHAIRAVKEAITIPLVANGDVTSLSDAISILEKSGADAVMIGRAHYGAPWLAGLIAAEANGQFASGVPVGNNQISDYIIKHYEDMLILYGSIQGMRQARKHLGWYIDRHLKTASAELRRAVMTSTNPDTVITTIKSIFSDSQLRSAA